MQTEVGGNFVEDITHQVSGQKFTSAARDIETQLRSFININLVYSDDDLGYDNDSSFLNEGLIDSMGVMELVAFVQSAFGIAVESPEVTPDNFDSVNKLADFVRRKLAVAEKHNAGTGRAAGK